MKEIPASATRWSLFRGLDSTIEGLDRARRAFFDVALRSPALAFVLRHRARRVEARAAAAIVVAFALSIVAPAFMLALGPILFGVPHVASEVRYLVVRRGLPRRWLVGLAVGCVAMSGLRILEQVLRSPGACARIEVALAVVLAAFAAASAAEGRAGFCRFAVALVILVGAGVVAVKWALLTRLVFIHAHNFGALVLWLFVFRRHPSIPRVATGLLGFALVLLLSGATVPWTARLGGLSALGVDLVTVARWLSPGVALSVALPLALVHAFSDSVHYGAWLALIPEEEARAEGSLTFKMTARSLLNDFGATGVIATAAAMLVVLSAALMNLGETRRIYFSFAGFHGYLEIAVLVALFVRGKRHVSRGHA